jgi:lysozyme family protein
VADKFSTAINRVLGAEGGYANNPADPGGETNWGISKRSYPKCDIKGLTREVAVELYHRDFWVPAGCEALPLGIASQLLDFAVNSGIRVAVCALQRAVGVADDGVVGPHTRAAIAAAEPHDLVMRLLAQRLRFMAGLKGWPAFGAGWARRVAQQLDFGASDV